MLTAEQISQSLSACLDEISNELSVNDRGFVSRVYQGGLEKYTQRLCAYGMSGLSHVLDAGCGFGQWSLALAQMNERVCSIDAAANRIKLLSLLGKRLGLDNLHVSQQTLPATQMPDAEFNAVLCYGVIFITDWKETLRNFYRCLKAGGILYVNANGLGWFKNLWYSEPNKTTDYSPRAVAARAWQNTYEYHEGRGAPVSGQLLIEPLELRNELERLGFIIIAQGSEGVCRHPEYSGDLPSPFFKGLYLGDVGVHEVLAVKISYYGRIDWKARLQSQNISGG
jgi:ubiquinone/menaquinone biosynthesis C-methylase UbiE